MKKLVILVIVAAIMLIGCTKDNTNENKGNDINSEPKTGKNASKQIYPLTGIKADEGVDQRPVGVMVNNHPKARPQSGLSQADIVFEILAEGNITRFLAIYQSDFPDVVGPVRSAREYYFDLAERYGALYVYHGAANFVNDMIKERNIEYINGAIYDNDGIVFKRESFRKAPHNSYFQFDSVSNVAADKDYEMTTDMEPLPFLDDDKGNEISGEPAERVRIDYASTLSVMYEYDHENGSYLRLSDDEPTIELDTEEQIKADNLFIIETDHEVIDDEGRRAIDLESGGKGLLIQKGNVQQVDWKNENGRVLPVKDGEVIGFVPGQTWINIVPSNPGIDQSVSVTDQ